MFFSRKSKQDVFSQRKTKQELWRAVRRIVDSTAPNITASEVRKTDRCTRCLPALLAPWDGEVITGEPYGVLTKDFSDDGVALILSAPREEEQVICGFWCGSPVFVAGRIRQMRPMGGGFWLAGVELVELINNSHVPELIPLAQQLDANEAVMS